jgi:hypothetical protein
MRPAILLYLLQAMGPAAATLHPTAFHTKQPRFLLVFIYSIRPVCIPELPALMVQNHHWPLIGRDLLYGRKPGGAGVAGGGTREKDKDYRIDPD